MSEWNDWLLKIAEAQGERELVIQYARLLFLQSNWFQEKYYAILKGQIEPERWGSFIEELLREVGGRTPYLPRELMAGIFISEGWMERLLNLVRQVPLVSVIAQYEPHLAEAYSAELVELYAQAITDYLKDHVNRNHYQEACRCMSRMIKLGGRQKVGELVDLLQKSYPRRMVLMEELNRVCPQASYPRVGSGMLPENRYTVATISALPEF